ncbi:MAG: M66 family metalloprotease [Myxococcales bacterium]
MASRAAGGWGKLALSVITMLSVSAGCGKSTSQSPRMTSAGDAAIAGESPNEGGAPSGGVPGEGGVPSLSGGGALEGGSPPGGAGEPSSAAEGGVGGEPVPAAPALSLRAVSIYQTHELPLMQAGSEVVAEDRPAPLVAGKRALVRALFDVEPGFVNRSLIGVLDLKTPQLTRTLVSERMVTKSSLQDDLASTFVFDVNGNDLSPNSTYRVRVLEADTTPLARFPEDGYVPLGAKALPAFELVLVPFVANGHAPLTGEAELSGLRRRLLALYPSIDVHVSVAAPVTLPYVVNGDGDGWDNALDRIYQLRADAAPAHDVFYYGAMAPDDTFANYCASDCILGYSTVAEDTDVDSRGSIGITVFQDGSGTKDAWDTVAHELGHALGREHAPCGITDPSDLDSEYPYANATLGGIYGFDFDAMKLIKPKPAKDVMSYCTPVWISDYTYRGIFERLDFIASESFRALALAPPALFRLARVGRRGESRWLGERRRGATSRRAKLDLLDHAGRRLGEIEAQVVPVDHARGGYVWLPSAELARWQQLGAASVDLGPSGGSVLAL